MISEEKGEIEDVDDYNVTNQWYQAQEISREREPVGRYAAKTFGWMFLSPTATFLVSVAGCIAGTIIYIFIIPCVISVLVIAEVAVVLFLSARINKILVGATRGLPFLYAVSNGIVFSAYFLMCNVLDMVIVSTTINVFFGVTAAVGYVTKADLNKLRNFPVSGLIFLMAFWLFGMSINPTRFEMIARMVGILIFLLLTAYDTQRIRTYHAAYDSNLEMARKASIFSALQLYLGFTNLFLYLLRVLGRRK